MVSIVRRGYRLALLLAVCVLLALCLPGAVQDAPPVVYVWTPPADGSPVEYYVIQLSFNDGAFIDYDSTTTSEPVFQLAVEYENKYVIRVAGVDADGDRGPFSEPSEGYIPPEPDPTVLR